MDLLSGRADAKLVARSADAAAAPKFEHVRQRLDAMPALSSIRDDGILAHASAVANGLEEVAALRKNTSDAFKESVASILTAMECQRLEFLQLLQHRRNISFLECLVGSIKSSQPLAIEPAGLEALKNGFWLSDDLLNIPALWQPVVVVGESFDLLHLEHTKLTSDIADAKALVDAFEVNFGSCAKFAWISAGPVAAPFYRQRGVARGI
jgi:hypothetical protein